MWNVVKLSSAKLQYTAKVIALFVLGDLQMQSRVKWFDNVKGYGFIESPDGKDIFVHYKQITGDGYRTLKEGQMVEFELSQGEKGPLAIDVKAIS